MKAGKKQKKVSKMRIVKDVGPILVAEEDGKFFLIREHVERSQNFDTEKDCYAALRNWGIRWRPCQ